MAIDYESLGKRIANARKQTGITQEALGEQLNMTRKHISVIETAINRPSLNTLVDIANALNVSADDLLVDSFWTTSSVLEGSSFRSLLTSFSPDCVPLIDLFTLSSALESFVVSPPISTVMPWILDAIWMTTSFWA